MEDMDRTVAKIALITVIITLVILCLVYVYLVVERVGWGHTAFKPTLFTVYTHHHYVAYRKELLNLR
jgi:hypothetical protein